MGMKMKIGVGFGLHKWIDFIFYLPSKIADIRKLKRIFFLMFFISIFTYYAIFWNKRKSPK